MLHADGRLPGGQYDCYVAGSGPAGLSLALTLAEHGKRVLVLESGGERRARPELANSIGYGHYSAGYWNAHWSRVLGGTSDVWSGWCTALRALDFDNPAVGTRWPIDRAELLPYYRRAAPILDHDPAFVDFEAPLLAGFAYRPVPVAAPTRFGDKYRDRLSRPGLDVALGWSVAGLQANEGRTALTGFRAFHHESGAVEPVSLTPRQPLVLAAGGIGNAQLLRQPPQRGEIPVGNESGLAGRFLMEHPHLSRAAELVVDEELDRYWPEDNKGRGAHAVIADDALSRQEGLYGCGMQCSRRTTNHEMARFLSRELGRTFYHYGITVRCEMLPSDTNEVFLLGERDPSGLFRPGVRCVLQARDLLNVDRTLRLLGESLIRLQKGRVRVNNDRIYKQVGGGGHVMGTTRMGRIRASSVVDGDCRVHGYGNLFVAGSSVFPTGGFANPTLTIVALAVRLADMLAR